MSDAPFATGNFGGSVVNLAAFSRQQREQRMDAWVGQTAAGLATGDGGFDGAEQIASAAWTIAAALERAREQALTEFDKEDA